MARLGFMAAIIAAERRAPITWDVIDPRPGLRLNRRTQSEDPTMDRREAFEIGSAAAVLMLASGTGTPRATPAAATPPLARHPDDVSPLIRDWATCWPASAEVRPRSPSR